MHMRVNCIDSECTSPGYTLCATYIVSAYLEKQYNGWLEYRSDEDAMVAVDT